MTQLSAVRAVAFAQPRAREGIHRAMLIGRTIG
jgi:hypothetical protein